jgi:beta-lactamase regulating signal transducer with metallopeptidase domain
MNTIEGITIRWQPWTMAAILNHLWQSSLVAVVILFLMLAARRASARTRWIIGWMGLIKFALPLIWFNATVSRLMPPSMDGWNYLPASLTASAVGLVSGDAAQTHGQAHAVVSPYASSAFLLKSGFCIWVAGAILMMGAWCFRGYRLRRWLLATAKPISAALGRRAELASARVGLADVPHCVTITEPSGPGIVGVFSTVVVLPNSLEDSLSAGELDSVLIHEFTHLKRRDPFLAALQAVVVRLFWFNPVVWFLDRSLHVETEKSCDETVLDITADARVYAGGIVKVVRQSLGLREPGFAGATGVPIVARIKNILARSAAPHRRRPMLAIIGSALALVAFSGFSGAIRTGAAVYAPTGRVLVVRSGTPWTQIPDFETEFGDLGFASATIKPADMATTDFTKYSLIVIPGSPGQGGFCADYAKVADRFDRFVQGGGTLLLEVKGVEGEDILRQCFRAIPAQSDSGDSRAP